MYSDELEEKIKISPRALRDIIIDGVEHCVSTGDYYKLNHIPIDDFEELESYLSEWLSKHLGD